MKYSNLKALTFLLVFYSTIIFLFLVQQGDIKINPGPREKQPKHFSCCSWKVNSLLLANNKISLLTVYNTIHQYDVISLSEIDHWFLDIVRWSQSFQTRLQSNSSWSPRRCEKGWCIYSLTLFRMGDKKTPYHFSPVTFTNAGIGSKSFLSFSFNPLARVV